LEFNLEAAYQNTNIFLNFFWCDIFPELVIVTFIAPAVIPFKKIPDPTLSLYALREGITDLSIGTSVLTLPFLLRARNYLLIRVLKILNALFFKNPFSPKV